MGAGRTLGLAITDLRATPPDAPERRLALPILVQLRLEIPSDPARQTKKDREFLMRTRDVERYLRRLETGEERGRKEGRKEGRAEGLAEAVLTAYRVRFGAAPAALVKVLEGAKDPKVLGRWLEVVAARSAEEIAALVQEGRSSQPARPATAKARPRSTKPRSTSPGRATSGRRAGATASR